MALININIGSEKIMGTLAEVVAKIDDLTANLAVVDAAVESLYDQIKAFTDQGITPAVADQLLAKLDEVKAAADKISTDD